MLGALAAMPEVRLLPRTTVFGYYDHNVLGAVERVSDHLPVPPRMPGAPALLGHSREAGGARHRRASSA